MSDFPVGLREVVPDQTVPEKTKEFAINTGMIIIGAQAIISSINYQNPYIWKLPMFVLILFEFYQ